MEKKCVDCFHFKTREYRDVESVDGVLNSNVRLKQALDKAKKEEKPAKYWRCDQHKTKHEIYTTEATATSLVGCERFDG